VDEGVERSVIQKLEKGWTAKITLGERAGVLEVQRVEVSHPHPAPDGLPLSGGLTAGIFHLTQPEACRQLGNAQATVWGDFALPHVSQRRVTRRPASVGRPRQRLQGDVQLALLYVEELRSGQKRVNVRVAQRLGDPYDARGVTKRISKLRDGSYALLTPTRRGSAGGELTEFALSLLSGEQRAAHELLRPSTTAVASGAAS
jgi:hypothetical protein